MKFNRPVSLVLSDFSVLADKAIFQPIDFSNCNVFQDDAIVEVRVEDFGAVPDACVRSYERIFNYSVLSHYAGASDGAVCYFCFGFYFDAPIYIAVGYVPFDVAFHVFIEYFGVG